MARRKKSQPTVCHSFEVDQAAIALFKNWFCAPNWLAREQKPDFHVDYRVEFVTSGEPAGLHFQAQIKGRSMHKRKTSKFSEPMKTKHLRYYLRCEEPVFIFLIDPATRDGNWLFAQRYLRENVATNELRIKKMLTLHFESQRSIGNLALFEKELRGAYQYMRDLHPCSPASAILAEQNRLENLDPRYRVQITATGSSVKVQALPRQPITKPPGLKFLNTVGATELQAFFEKGQSFQVKAKDIQAEGLPILSDILNQVGDVKIAIRSGETFKGCLQLFSQPETETSFVQVDGEWLLAPKRVSFLGQLADSPLRVEFSSESQERSKPEHGTLRFKLDWGAWEGQPLLSLSYFHQLAHLATATEYDLICLIRGNHAHKATYTPPQSNGRSQFKEAINWLSKTRHLAHRLGVNPPFPAIGVLNGKKADDVRLLLELQEFGHHEQDIAGQIVAFSGDNNDNGFPKREEPLTITNEEVKTMDFFGMPVPFGPLHHTFTDMYFVSATPINDNRVELTFQGGSKSIWRVDYQTPSTGGPAAGSDATSKL